MSVQVPKQAHDYWTYAIDVTRSSPPLWISITTVTDSLEPRRNVVVQRGVLSEIKLVAIAVAISAASMACFGAARDNQRASASSLECDGAVDGAGEETIVGCAAWVALGCAAA